MIDIRCRHCGYTAASNGDCLLGFCENVYVLSGEDRCWDDIYGLAGEIAIDQIDMPQELYADIDGARVDVTDELRRLVTHFRDEDVKHGKLRPC